MVKEHDIIKVNNELLVVTYVSNNGSYKCKNKKGQLIWTSFLQKPQIVKSNNQ